MTPPLPLALNRIPGIGQAWLGGRTRRTGTRHDDDDLGALGISGLRECRR